MAKEVKNKIEFNGYSFDDIKMRKQMKYVVITNGDLDLNGAYSFRTKRDLKKYLEKEGGYKEVIAVFEVKDITHPF